MKDFKPWLLLVRREGNNCIILYRLPSLILLLLSSVIGEKINKILKKSMHCTTTSPILRPSKWWGVTQLQFNNWLILANPVLSALVCSEIHCAFLRKSTRRKNSVSRNSTVRDTLELENTALLNTIPSIWQICTIILHRNFRELKVSQFWVPNLKAYFEFHTNTRYLFEEKFCYVPGFIFIFIPEL